MPELIEVEIYRLAAEPVVGRTILRIDTPDAWYLRGGATPDAVRAALDGARVLATARHGKLLLFPTSHGTTLGLRFGMTGRLVVDGEAPIDRLEYSSGRVAEAWVRFRLAFDDGGELAVVDPRRLGGVELDPDRGRLGPEASTVTAAQLRAVLQRSGAPLKAVLLDQHRIAGLGNLLVDETLWTAGLDPALPARSLDPDDVGRLAAVIRATVRRLSRRGGSHTGNLQPARHRGALCPRCATPLLRRTIGGRTTYSCPAEQSAT